MLEHLARDVNYSRSATFIGADGQVLIRPMRRTGSMSASTAGCGPLLWEIHGQPDGLRRFICEIRESRQNMLASRRWRDWMPPQEIENRPDSTPTKPPKGSSVSFGGRRSSHSRMIAASDAFPSHDPAAWRDPVAEWLNSACMRHPRCFGGVTACIGHTAIGSFQTLMLPARERRLSSCSGRRHS